MESKMTQKAHFWKKYDTLLKQKFGSPVSYISLFKDNTKTGSALKTLSTSQESRKNLDMPDRENRIYNKLLCLIKLYSHPKPLISSILFLRNI